MKLKNTMSGINSLLKVNISKYDEILVLNILCAEAFAVHCENVFFEFLVVFKNFLNVFG